MLTRPPDKPCGGRQFREAGGDIMAIRVSVNGKKLFGGNANAEVMGELDGVIGEMVREHRVVGRL
jgi:hypothetical protein